MNARRQLRGYASRFLRQGRLYRRLAAELARTARLSHAELVAYQEEHLRRIVAHACRWVPRYRQLFDDLRIRPDEIRTLDDLPRLPIIRKADIRGREREFVARRPRWQARAYTSGTTGTPLFLSRDRFSVNFERATHRRQWRWAGADENASRAVLRSELVVPAGRTEPPFWERVPSQKCLLLSSYHMSDRTIPHYLDELRAFRPDVMEAYPWSAYRLARYMEIRDEPRIPIRAVFTSSELLSAEQRDLIARFFGPVFDLLGNAERVMCFMMCERGRYHYAMDYSIVEFAPAADGLHEIVGTTLHNRAMPLLRYATGDLVRRSADACPCGRAFPIIESIEGRQDDVILTPSGRSIGCLNTALKGVPNLVECQIVQETLDAVRVLIVPAPSFTDADEAHLLGNLRDFMGPELRIDVEHRDAIARSANGKYKLVISKLATAAS